MLWHIVLAVGVPAHSLPHKWAERDRAYITVRILFYSNSALSYVSYTDWH